MATHTLTQALDRIRTAPENSPIMVELSDEANKLNTSFARTARGNDPKIKASPRYIGSFSKSDNFQTVELLLIKRLGFSN